MVGHICFDWLELDSLCDWLDIPISETAVRSYLLLRLSVYMSLAFVVRMRSLVDLET
jgi:hypothetical protein